MCRGEKPQGQGQVVKGGAGVEAVMGGGASGDGVVGEDTAGEYVCEATNSSDKEKKMLEVIVAEPIGDQVNREHRGEKDAYEEVILSPVNVIVILVLSCVEFSEDTVKHTKNITTGIITLESITQEQMNENSYLAVNEY